MRIVGLGRISLSVVPSSCLLTFESIVIVRQVGQGVLCAAVGRKEGSTRLGNLRRQGRRTNIDGGTQGGIQNLFTTSQSHVVVVFVVVESFASMVWYSQWSGWILDDTGKIFCVRVSSRREEGTKTRENDRSSGPRLTSSTVATTTRG